MALVISNINTGAYNRNRQEFEQAVQAAGTMAWVFDEQTESVIRDHYARIMGRAELKFTPMPFAPFPALHAPCGSGTLLVVPFANGAMGGFTAQLVSDFRNGMGGALLTLSRNTDEFYGVPVAFHDAAAACLAASYHSRDAIERAPADNLFWAPSGAPVYKQVPNIAAVTKKKAA
jgi:hypothetical protein